jgi:biopolymer transport protein ExbD
MKHSDIAHFRQLNSLRRRFIARSRRFPPALEPAAMVDVVLLVLLFFMISSSYITRPGVRIRLPETEFSEGIPMNAMVVTLTQAGQVFFNERRITLPELRPAMERARAENPTLPLVIEADERVTLDTQMAVYREAARLGIQDIAIATRNPRPGRREP